MHLFDQAKRVVRTRVSRRTWNKLSRLKARQFSVRTTPCHTEPVADDDRVLSCMIAYNQHGAYCIPNASITRPVPQALIRGKVWEGATIELIARHAGEGDLVHAGTYFGDFLPALAAAVAPGAMVWAFEPHAENFRCSEVTLLLNGIRNVRIRRAGLGGANRSCRLLTQRADGADMGGLCRFVDDDLETGGLATEDVPLVSLDTALPADRRVSVIHLDIEEYEQNALAGGLETLRRCRPVLILETEPTAGWIAENLAPLGYARQAYVDNNSVFVAAP